MTTNESGIQSSEETRKSSNEDEIRSAEEPQKSDNENEIRSVGVTKKSKRRFVVVLLIALLVASVVGNCYLWFRYSEKKSQVERLEDIYSVSYFHFDSLTVESFEKKVASGEEFIVVITRPGCSYCQALELPFIRLAEMKGIKDKIYHLNVAILRQDNEAWTRFKDNYGFEGTPTYARFADGRNVSCVGWTYERSYVGYDMIDDWTDEQSDFFAS